MRITIRTPRAAKLLLFVLILVGLSSFVSAVSTEGQILNLHMEDDCTDSTGNYDFINGGVTNTTGVWDGALENTDGADDKDCYYTASDFLSNLQNYTFNLWIYSDKFTADENVFGRHDGTAVSWVLHIEAGPYIRVYNGNGGWREPNAYPPPINVWQMVTIVGNDAGTWIILNDTLIFKDAIDGSMDTETDNRLIFWDRDEQNPAAYTNFEGKLDEVNIWNRSIDIGSCSSVGDICGGDITILFNDGSPDVNSIYPFVADTTPPELSNINLTSNPNGSLTEPYNSTGDLTPTFTFDTNEGATATISNANNTFESCSTTGGTSHICTLPFNNTLVCGTDYVYVNVTDTSDNSRYDEWQVWACNAVGASGDSFEVKQYIAVDWFNNTHIRYNKTILAINYYSTYQEFDIPTMAGWTKITGDDPMKVAEQASNTTVYQNTSLRGITADDWYNQSAVTINGSNTNRLDMILPIDPPHAFMKDGIADCSLNPSIDQDTVLAYTLKFINAGYFYINSIFKVAGFEFPAGCEIVIDPNAGGELVIG